MRHSLRSFRKMATRNSSHVISAEIMRRYHVSYLTWWGGEASLLSDSGDFMSLLECCIVSILCQNNISRLDTETTRGPHSDQRHISSFSIMQKLDDFMKSNRKATKSHSVVQCEDWANLQNNLGFILKCYNDPIKCTIVLNYTILTSVYNPDWNYTVLTDLRSVWLADLWSFD